MKTSSSFRILQAAASLAVFAASTAPGADLLWDGGTTNIATNGDGVSSYLTGTWSTGLANWDQGNGVAHTAWINGNPDNAIFGGTFAATGTRTVTIGSDVTVNQIKINTGSTGANRYDIGAIATQNDFAITFGGVYTDALPAIDGSLGAQNNNFNAKVVGTVNGGLSIRAASNITTPGSSGRFALLNANSTWTGDVIMLSGNLSIGTVMGDAANKLVLKGGALFMSGSAAATSIFARNIDVAAASGLGTNATTTGLQVMDLTGAMTGSANLTRYASVAGTAVSEVRFSGNMSGYAGTFEQTGASAATSIATIQTTATSAGGWKVSGGTLKLNTAANDAAIANGAGMSNLVMNGGTLNMNGKSEIINGLSGATGFVQNELLTTNSVLTLGDGDATAVYGGTIRNNAATGGTLEVRKIGSGTQTLGGTNSYSGVTTVAGGALLISGSLTVSNLNVSATLGGSGTIGGSATFSGGLLDPGGDAGGDRLLTLNGLVSGTGAIALTIDSPAVYNRINGSGVIDTAGMALNVVMNDTGWLAATDAAGLGAATHYDIVSNNVLGNFTNGTPLTPAEQAYWGVGASAKFFNFGGQDFLLTTGSFKLTAVTPVPEPGSLIFALGGGLFFLRRRR